MTKINKMKELTFRKDAKNGVTKSYYFKGNQEVQLPISELYISEQTFCRLMTFQNAYQWMLLKDNLKLCMKLNTLLNGSKQI